MSRKMCSQRAGSHCGKKKIIPSKQVPIFAWKVIAEVCASKLGFSQRSTCRGFSFASLQVGFVVCPRRTAFSRLDMKNVSRSILPHLSEGPRCRPKAPATKLLSTRLEAVSSVRLPQVTETLIFAWKMMPQVSVSKLGSSETKYWRTPVSGVKPEEENENVTEWCEEQKTHITYVYGWEASGPRKQRPLYIYI